MQLDRNILKYCTGMLINREGVVNLDLKIGAGPKLVIRKELKKDGQKILRMYQTEIELQEKIYK